MITSKFLIKLNHSYEQLDWIEELEDNWNDNGAKKFSKDFTSYVRAFLPSFIEVPFVAPTANETIQLEWKNDDYYIEVEISDKNLHPIHLHTIHLFIYNNIENKKIKDITLTKSLFTELVQYINNILIVYGFGGNKDD